MGEDIFIFVVGQIIVAAAIWGGIRKDIKNIHERLTIQTNNINHAHKRIDDFLMMNKRG